MGPTFKSGAHFIFLTNIQSLYKKRDKPFIAGSFRDG